MIFASFFESGALGLLIKGGWFMLPILLLGILAVAVIIERYRSLKILDKRADTIRQEVIDHIAEGDFDGAVEVCDNANGPIAAVLKHGLNKYLGYSELDYEPSRIEEQVNKSMEAYGVHVVSMLERHLPILATISSVAPMLGFLGTVVGMIGSFANIVATMGQVNIVEAAASGIETALLTTAFGLIIGIPAYMAFNYFMSTINNFVLEVEQSSAELIEAVSIKLTLGGK
ncbi:MAG: MotA/TolQ/ExbB proton channel family protein [Verrucomicrobiales bacterium]|nr:MotA/TolQ/ExbB proton channel family protein [Verrucomicrobiales bacterium]